MRGAKALCAQWAPKSTSLAVAVKVRALADCPMVGRSPQCNLAPTDHSSPSAVRLRLIVDMASLICVQ
jgi:hypothetical protein